ncbi:MAG: hypothetical protein ACRDP7_20080 [Trebonia sp.]
MRRRDTGVSPKFIAATAAAAALLAALAGCSAAAAGASAKASAAAKVRTSPVSATRKAAPAASKSPSATPTPKPKPTPSALPVGAADAGTLPQTSALPKTESTAFNNAVHDLWLAVTTGDPDYAKTAFFPEKAYEQVKAIADPESDWQGRLWLDFTLDLAAVHKLVKPGATLVKVIAPTQYEQWIPPGACYNSTGYWHLPGSRMVYREGGVTHSFGIASFISWRGNWYLIHLGALVRGGAYGIVDDPETGEGFPGPAGGC